MKKRFLIALMTLAGAFYLSSHMNVYAYPGCLVPEQECDCSVLPDLNNYGVMFGVKGCETVRLVFSGFIQTDFQYIRVRNGAKSVEISEEIVSVHNPKEIDNFLVRRARLRTEAILSDGWSGVLEMDFANREKGYRFYSGTTAPEQILTTENKHGIFGIADAYIEKYCSGQTLSVGYRKVRFGYEEGLPDYQLKTIERSVASQYFNNSIQPGPLSGSPLGLGSRRAGVFANGSYENFNYGVSLVNGYQGTDAFSNITNNELGIFGGLGYVGDINCADFEIGVNFGYLPKGNSQTLLLAKDGTGGAGNNIPSAPVPSAAIAAINPYIALRLNGFYVMAEILAARLSKGQANGVGRATPYGGTIAPSYMWNDNLEFAFRASFLNTDYRGVRISNIIYGAPDTNVYGLNNPGNGVFVAGDIYNKVEELYGGFNYYWLNSAVTLSVGYTWSQFKYRATILPGQELIEQSFMGPKTTVHQIRARLQLVF